MKFAVLALLGAVSASEVLIPEIEFDNNRVNQAGHRFESWAKRHEVAAKEDDRKTSHDLVRAIVRHRMQQDVNFGRDWKPLAEMDVEFVDLMTVNGGCNTEVATDCLTAHFLGKLNKPEVKQCIRTQAGCHNNWDELTPQEQEALAKKFDTKVETFAKAQQRYNDDLERDMEQAIEDHERRKKLMEEDFNRTILRIGGDLGCDQDCLEWCAKNNASDHEWEQCHCGKGVIEIKEHKVNTYAEIKAAYGDLNNLSDDQIMETNRLVSLY